MTSQDALDRVLVIIPTFNEAQNIESITNRLRRAVPDAHILVADDNAVNLKVASAMVLRLGYDVLMAVDGREAIDAVAAAHAGSQSSHRKPVPPRRFRLAGTSCPGQKPGHERL